MQVARFHRTNTVGLKVLDLVDLVDLADLAVLGESVQTANTAHLAVRKCANDDSLATR
jgi:hypothetical protein